MIGLAAVAVVTAALALVAERGAALATASRAASAMSS